MSDIQNPQGQQPVQPQPQYQQPMAQPQPQPQYQQPQYQQPQPQYQQPYGQPQYGPVKTPLPRYNVGSPWSDLANLDFKQIALICLGVSLCCGVIGIMASGGFSSVLSVISTLSNGVLFALIFSRLIPYIKDNAQFSMIALIGIGLYVIGGIVVLFAKPTSLSGIGSFLKVIAILGFLSYGGVAAALLLCGSKLKHFSLRSIVMLFGIGMIIMALGCLFLLGSSLGALGTAGTFALIGGLIVLVADIMLLIKLIGSEPIEDPYALPGEPLQ